MLPLLLHSYYTFSSSVIQVITWCQIETSNSLSLEENLLQNRKTSKESFTLFMTAAEYNGKNDKVKINLLLHCIGEKAKEVYNTFVFSSTKDSVKYSKG